MIFDLCLLLQTTISSLSHEHHGGLVDIVHDIGSKVSDAAHNVGASLATAGETISTKISDAIGHHHTESPISGSAEKEKHTEQPKSIVTVHANEVSGKIVDPAKEAKNVIDEFASNTAANITNTATDLLDFGVAPSVAKTKENSKAQVGLKPTESK